MTIQEAMRLIDDRVAEGARISIQNHPPFRYSAGDRWRDVPQTWTAQVGPVWVAGVAAHPAATAYSMEDAVISIGELLAQWAVI